MKKDPKNYTIIPVKCQKTKELFGIRGIYRESYWHLTWAFKMTEHQAKGEHIEDNTLSGNALFDATYPGCPHCGAVTYIICGNCKRILCSNLVNIGERFTCPWCGKSSTIGCYTSNISGVKSGSF